jgi:carbon storage regulator CsrA
MLILSRKAGGKIVIDGRIIVTVASITDSSVRVKVSGAPELLVHRPDSTEPIATDGASLKLNESILIGDRIVIKLLRIALSADSPATLGIQAPPELSVHRQEIFDAIQRSKQQNPVSTEPKPE